VQTDVLGEPYRRRVIELPADDEGPVIATLVSRKAAKPTPRAVLYLHGYNDYFFQTHVADFFVERGFDFYALDLRKYGRSLQPHQTANLYAAWPNTFPSSTPPRGSCGPRTGTTRCCFSPTPPAD
jgi:pimeloyl-ACP methyl ester carboxylesterase